MLSGGPGRALSRVLVREAIHRLKDLGLVRVKQGGLTIVLDPDEAIDPRVTVLRGWTRAAARR